MPQVNINVEEDKIKFGKFRVNLFWLFIKSYLVLQKEK